MIELEPFTDVDRNKRHEITDTLDEHIMDFVAEVDLAAQLKAGVISINLILMRIEECLEAEAP